ncbi:hypothetical protein KOW79_002348 [Hemibagrus wyckioides]|uniref:Ras-related protein Rab-4 n=1 Tax=Hemibagrus wyckioides TaxID=337641 RepID=A0A9D3P3J5_9TELE|nr:hypothetical protein KOW79_002348 [Hemibagrus wyckioides]
MSETYDFLFKFLVIGNAGTGKSCLLHQFIEKKFKDDSNHTIGVEFGSKIINVVNKFVKLQIWDTAGQERFRSVTRSYYRGAAGALLVYDITSRETYNALTNWLTDARMLASQNIVIILCGNKKDLDADREVTFLEASRFAQENELMFLETSALTGENVEEAFIQCARKILNKIESGELDPERMGSGIQYENQRPEHFVKIILGMGQQTQNSGETLPSPSFFFGPDKPDILGRRCALEQSGSRQRHQPRMMNLGPC